MIICLSKHHFEHLLCAKHMLENVDELKEFSRKYIRKERHIIEYCKKANEST